MTDLPRHVVPRLLRNGLDVDRDRPAIFTDEATAKAEGKKRLLIAEVKRVFSLDLPADRVDDIEMVVAVDAGGDAVAMVELRGDAEAEAKS